MRYALTLVLGVASSCLAYGARAAELETCSDINAVKTRMDCIERNTAKVNKTLELVAADVREQIGKIQQVIDKLPPDLSGDLEAIRNRLKVVEAGLAGKADKSDLGSYLSRNAVVRLHSQRWDTQCLDLADENQDFVHGWPCNESKNQRWQLEPR